MKLKSIKEVNVKGKIVFLRADLDVPVEKSKIKNQISKITDDSRLSAWFPTLEYLVRNGAQVIIAGHLGRPLENLKNQISKIKKEEQYSLEPVAKWIAAKINSTIQDIELEGFKGWKLAENVFVLENLRFFSQEEENEDEFSKKLSKLAQVYVNDAFASSHRAHASIVGITKYLPSYAGLNLQKEVEELSKILENPKRPLTIIVGGAKIETKLPLVEKMHHFADYVLVGGEIAENDKVLLKVAHEKIQGQKSALIVADLTQNGKDITQKSAENFVQLAQNSQTIVWNGPMGLIEEQENAEGTKTLAQNLSKLSAYKIVGGGDTVAYLKKLNLLEKFDFVSMGGGAMLEFLAGVKLPGIEVLRNK